MRLFRSSTALAFLLAASIGLAACTGAPSGSVTPAGTPVGSREPGASGEPGTVRLVARNVAFDPTALEVAAGSPFVIELDNQDTSVPHDVAIRRGNVNGEQVFRGQEFNGRATRTYAVPALTAGTYAFVCTIHPNMQGTLTVR